MSSIIKARLMSLHAPAESLPESPLKTMSKDMSTSPRTLKFADQNDEKDVNDTRKLPLMHPMAVEFAARKIAASGDLRKALDVCR
jgi:Cdc6-like AAA superfamily ATPase